VLLQAKNDFSDCAARYGGEEFVLLRLVKDQAEAIALGEKIRIAVEALDLSMISSQPLSPLPTITISIGGALWKPKFGEDKQILFEKADEMLYKAKATGRNRVCWHLEETGAIASSFY
jgi:diguanylate cyclase (GGDEF)-like protein